MVEPGNRKIDHRHGSKFGFTCTVKRGSDGNGREARSGKYGSEMHTDVLYIGTTNDLSKLRDLQREEVSGVSICTISPRLMPKENRPIHVPLKRAEVRPA